MPVHAGSRRIIWSRPARAPFVPVNAETAAWRARLPTAVTDAWAQSVDAFISSLKLGAVSGSNIWAKFDVIVITAHAENNWINIVQNAFNPGSPAGGPNFSGGGYVLDGADDTVDTNFNLSTGVTYTQNSAHVGIYTAAKTVENASVIGQHDGTDGTNIDPRNAASDVAFRINQAAETVWAAATSGVQHVIVNRSTSTATQLYNNGTAQTPGTNANATSTALNNANLLLGTNTGVNLASCTILDYTIGGSVTANEVTDIVNAFATLRAALGHP